MAKKEPREDPSQMIDQKIHALDDWRGAMLNRIRKIILQSDPGVVETVKWKKPSNPAGVPVWEHTGILCTGDAFKGKVKLTFAKGALLDDPSGLFNASLNGNAMRAIDLFEGDSIDKNALKALVRSAIQLNVKQQKEKEGKK